MVVVVVVVVVVGSVVVEEVVVVVLLVVILGVVGFAVVLYRVEGSCDRLTNVLGLTSVLK